MTTYRCVWCGESEERERDDELVSCTRCVREFARLLGFVPRALMFPLDPGEDPGPPAAATKRFVFRDASTGAVRGRTWVAEPELRRASGEG